MKNKPGFIIKSILGFSILCILFAYFVVFSNMQKPKYTNGNMMTILIDPGHGGADPGKAGTLKNESIINLSISLKLAEKLMNKNFNVVMTRTEETGLFAQGSDKWDKTVDMDLRKSMITSSNASMLISIHQNAYPDSRCRGAQIFYSDISEENKKLADLLQSKLKLISPFENKRQPQINNNLKMLRENTIPSAIVECGFLSNKEEEYLLNMEEYQEKIAQAVYEGICTYYEITP